MDFAEANVFANSLLEAGPIAGWKLIQKKAHGKSAVLMIGQKDEEIAAIKIFHPGLIENYGKDSQLIRLNREKELIDKHHPNIIKILDAGECVNSGKLFVAMEYDLGIPLSKALNNIKKNDIKKIIEQLAKAAKQLEDWGLTHRDIKPDNIHIDLETFSNLKLLDFGVVKPHGDHSATSTQVSKNFLGTHQYSPPEMIHGKECDSIDGWRAITFYQIGAVLHDLIKCTPIFKNATNRHADLVAAIDNENILIESEEVDPLLCNLATRCLLKKPEDRLQLLRWEDFMFSEREEKSSLSVRRDTLIRRLSIDSKINYIDVFEQSEAKRLKEIRLNTIIKSARNQFDQCLAELGDLIPERTTVLDGHIFPNVSITYTFIAKPKMGIPNPFKVQITIEEISADVIQVFARASIGLDKNQVGWISLGNDIPTLDGMNKIFMEWMLSIIEEITVK